MNDIDSRLRGTIQELVGEVRMRPDLASTAMASGRRRLRRRRTGTVLVAALAVVSVGASTPYLLGRYAERNTPLPGIAADPGSLPLAEGVPGAAQRPDLVGSDAGILHFDVDVSAIPDLATISWSTGRESERVSVSRDVTVSNTPSYLTVTVAPPERPMSYGPDRPLESRQVTVAGRPATLAHYAGTVVSAEPDSTARRGWSGWRLSWEPVDGLPVVISGGPDGEALQMMAGALRFDRARRCVQPMRVTGLPSGAKLLHCAVQLDAAGALRSASFFADLPEPFRHVQVGCGADVRGELAPNRTVDGRPATWVADERSLTVAGAGDRPALRVSGETEEEVTALLPRVEFVGDPRKPETWPRSPVG